VSSLAVRLAISAAPHAVCYIRVYMCVLIYTYIYEYESQIYRIHMFLVVYSQVSLACIQVSFTYTESKTGCSRPYI